MNLLTGELSGVLIVFAVVFTIAYVLLNWQRPKVNDGLGLRLPPALPAVPILGSLPFFPGVDDIPAYFLKKSKELGAVFSFYAGSR